MSAVNAREVSERLGVHYQTVRNWIASDKIRASKGAAGEWEIPVSEMERIEMEPKPYSPASVRAVRTALDELTTLSWRVDASIEKVRALLETMERG